MSILIKGMEMPKDGEWVNINICSDGGVYFVTSQSSKGFSFYGNYKGEAIEIPPHGRLVDADDLLAMVKRAMEDNDMYKDDYRDVRDWLAVAPTVIEAEGGE